MPSLIDITKPIYGTPTTQSVRDNFTVAQQEITDLQSVIATGPFIPLAGGVTMTGRFELSGPPQSNLQPATKQYVDNIAMGGGSGGVMEAPLTGMTYVRGKGTDTPPVANDWFTSALLTDLQIGSDKDNLWTRFGADATYSFWDFALDLADTNMFRYHRANKILELMFAGVPSMSFSDNAVGINVPVTLAGDPTSNLQAATKQYVDNLTSGVSKSYIDTQDNLRVLKTGDVMTGALTLPIGSSTATSLNFGTANTGLYQSGTTIIVGIAGTANLQLASTYINALQAVRFKDGAESAPTITFANENQTGLYRHSAGTIRITGQGFDVASFTGPSRASAFFGPVSLVGNATLPLHAVPLQQVVTSTATNVGRNLIHNSMFNIAQRGTGPWSSGYTVDRWLLGRLGNLNTISVTQQLADDTHRAGIGDQAVRFVLNNTFTGNAGAGAGTYLDHRMEDVRRLAGKTVVVSFYAISSVALKLGVNMYQIFGTGGSPSIYVTVLPTGTAVSVTNTWARYSVVITLPSIAGKTLGTAGDDSTFLRFWYSAGANVNPEAGNIGVQAGTIVLWGVQLEIGSTATPLEKPDPQQDLAKCQRFYQVGQVVAGGYSAAIVTAQASLALPVTMRGTPIIAITGSFDGALTSPTQQVISGNMLLFGGTTPSAGTGWSMNRQFTVSADL